jgi:hypothetical protein
VRRAALLTALGAAVLVASLWLPRVRAVSFEDFYDTYGGRLGIPEAITATGLLALGYRRRHS